MVANYTAHFFNSGTKGGTIPLIFVLQLEGQGYTNTFFAVIFVLLIK